MREQLLDRMIKIYGFEHEIVIDFARMCESDNFTDKDLEMVVELAQLVSMKMKIFRKKC